MKNLTVNQQKPSQKHWIEETGSFVPYNRVSPFERSSERNLASIAKKALDLNERLSSFKSHVKKVVVDLYDEFIKENNGKRGKGNVTLFNFDRSIKVEVDVNESIIIDESFVELAKNELSDLLADGLDGAKEWVEPLVMDAFSTSGGRLDYKKVLGLKKHQARITDERFAKAMAFIDKGIRRPSSKQYFRVYLKDTSGEYQAIKLNFSDVETEA